MRTRLSRVDPGSNRTGSSQALRRGASLRHPTGRFGAGNCPYRPGRPSVRTAPRAELAVAWCAVRPVPSALPSEAALLGRPAVGALISQLGPSRLWMSTPELAGSGFLARQKRIVLHRGALPSKASAGRSMPNMVRKYRRTKLGPEVIVTKETAIVSENMDCRESRKDTLGVI